MCVIILSILYHFRVVTDLGLADKLWQADPSLSEVLEEAPLSAFGKATDLDEVDEAIWAKLSFEQRVAWLEALGGEEAVPAILTNLSEVEEAKFMEVKLPKLDVVAETLWSSWSMLKRDFFLRHSAMYSVRFRREYTQLPQRLVPFFVESPTPHCTYILHRAWSQLDGPLRFSFLCAIFSEGPLAALFTKDSFGSETKIPAVVVREKGISIATHSL